MKYTAIIGGERIEIELTRPTPGTLAAKIDGTLYDLAAKTVEPGVYWLNWQNRSLEFAVTPDGENYTVSFSGRRLSVEMADSRTALKRALQHGQDGVVEVRAPMPGKIVKVLVAEGAEVEANAGIIVMEAMKMQNEIKSPKKGTVRKLSVGEGTAVSSGDILATVE